MLTARAWKALYRREREALGEAGLGALVERAPRVVVREGGALVFPHTRLEVSGELVGAVAAALVEAGCEEVLAIGVLHGGREEDAPLVAAARAGDVAARAALRGVHGPGAPGCADRSGEEFSLDGLAAMLATAARARGRRPPRVVERYPFLVGEDVSDLPGMDELRRIVERGAAVVATADPIHHGVGYGTPPAERLPRDAAATLATARAWVERGLELLCAGDVKGFLESAAATRSDFASSGPVVAALLGAGAGAAPARSRVLDLVLVDYAETLGAEDPTWVAGALVELEAAA